MVLGAMAGASPSDGLMLYPDTRWWGNGLISQQGRSRVFYSPVDWASIYMHTHKSMWATLSPFKNF